MAFTQDPRFDAAFIDNVDNTEPTVTDLSALTIDWLPIMLTRNAGQIGFSRTYASPAAGGLGEGDQIDSSPGSWITLSQTDWVNGLLEDTAYAATTKFNDAVADTRYTGVLTLPPKVYGPYAFPSGSGHTTVPAVRYGNNFYIVNGSRLYKSTFDENAVSGTSVIANWTITDVNASGCTALTVGAVVTGAYFTSTDWVMLVKNTNTGIRYNSNGTYSGALGAAGWALRYALISGNKLLACPGTATSAYAWSDHTGTWTVGTLYSPGASTGTIPTGIVAFNGHVYITTNVGLFRIMTSGTFLTTAVQVLTWEEQESYTSGQRAAVWSGKLYLPMNDGLIAWDGSAATWTNIGLDTGVGIVSTVSRKIVCMASSNDTLYALTSESGKSSGIFAMTGDGVWHCLYTTANRLYQIFLDGRSGVHSGSGLTVMQMQQKLWWTDSTNSYYMYVGKNTSNWSQVSPALGTTFYRGFAATGSYTTSWWGGAYQQIVKDIHGVIVGHKSWSTANAADVTVDIEVDRSGTWVALTCDKYDGMQHHFISVAGTWASKTVTVGASTLSVTLDGVTGISAGTFMRIGGEVLQAKTVVGSVVTFARAANSAIAVGSIVYPAEAAGVEWRIRVSLATSDQNATPEVLRVSTEYAYQVLAKARYTLYIKCSNEVFTNKPNGSFPYDAETYRAKLKPWITRSTPFWMMTPTGEKALVKIINAAEAQVQDHQPAQTGKYSPSSIVTVTLAEVEVKR